MRVSRSSSSSEDLTFSLTATSNSFPQDIDSSVSSLGQEKFSHTPSSGSLEGKKVLPGTSDLSISTNEKGFQISRKAFSFFEQVEEDISLLQEQINNEIIDEDTKPKVLQLLHTLIQTLSLIEEKKRTEVADSIVGLQVDLIEKTDLSLTESIDCLYAFLNVNRHNSLTEDAKLTLQYFVSKILSKQFNPLKEPDDSHLITLLRASYEIMSAHQLDPATLKALEEKLPIYSNIQTIESWLKKWQLLGKSSPDQIKQKNWTEWWLFAKPLKKDSYSRQLFMAWTEAVRCHGTSPLIGEVFHSTSWTHLFVLWKIFPEPQDTLYTTIFEACKNSLKKVRGKVNADEVVKLLNRHIELRYKVDAPPITSKLEQLELDLIKLVAPPIKALKPFCLIFQRRLEHSCPMEFKNMFHSFLTGKHTFSLEEKELLTQTAAKLRIYASANKTLQSEEWLAYAEALESLHFDKSTDEALLYTTHCYYLYKEANIKLRHLVPELITKCSDQTFNQFRTWLAFTWDAQTCVETPLLGAVWWRIINRESFTFLNDPGNTSKEQLLHISHSIPYIHSQVGIKEFLKAWQENVTAFVDKLDEEEAPTYRELFLKIAFQLRTHTKSEVLKREDWLAYSKTLASLQCDEGYLEALSYLIAGDQIENLISGDQAESEKWVQMVKELIAKSSNQTVKKFSEFLKVKWDCLSSSINPFLGDVWLDILDRNLQDGVEESCFTQKHLSFLVERLLPSLKSKRETLFKILDMWEKSFWLFLNRSDGTDLPNFTKNYEFFKKARSLIALIDSDTFELYYLKPVQHFPEGLNYSRIFKTVVRHIKTLYNPKVPINEKYCEGLFYCQLAQNIAKEKFDIHAENEFSTLNMLCHYLSLSKAKKKQIYQRLMEERCAKGIEELSNDLHFLKLVYLSKSYPNPQKPKEMLEFYPYNINFPPLQDEIVDHTIYFGLLDDLIECGTSGALLHAARLLSSKGNIYLKNHSKDYKDRLKAISHKLKTTNFYLEDHICTGIFLLISMIDSTSQEALEQAFDPSNRQLLLALANDKDTLGYGEHEEKIETLALKIFDFLLTKEHIIPQLKKDAQGIEANLNMIEYLLFYFYKLNVYNEKNSILVEHLTNFITLLNKIFVKGGDFVQNTCDNVSLDFKDFIKTLSAEESLKIGRAKVFFAVELLAKGCISHESMEEIRKTYYAIESTQKDGT